MQKHPANHMQLTLHQNAQYYLAMSRQQYGFRRKTEVTASQPAAPADPDVLVVRLSASRGPRMWHDSGAPTAILLLACPCAPLSPGPPSTRTPGQTEAKETRGGMRSPESNRRPAGTGTGKVTSVYTTFTAQPVQLIVPGMSDESCGARPQAHTRTNRVDWSRNVACA